MKKRAFSLILAVLMVLSVLPVMTLSIGAEGTVAPVADFDYDALYVQDGLYSHLSFLEASEADNTAAWLNIMGDGEAYADKGANEELQKYVKVNTGTETYSLSSHGTYYKTVNGNVTLKPTADDPALYAGDKISVVAGNTLRFGEGFICSPWHQVGYYATDASAEPTAFSRLTHSNATLSNGNKLSTHQNANTMLNLPDVETSKDHTVQLVMSVNNRTDEDEAKSSKSNYNGTQGHRGTRVASVSFFELCTESWMYREGYDYSLSHRFLVRDVTSGSWGTTVNLGNLHQFHNGWEFDPEFATKSMDAAERTTKDPSYSVYDYTQLPSEIVGVPYSYTVVSDVLTKTIPAGDDDKTGKNSYYAAKADVKLYYGDVVLGSEYFGRLHEDGLLWIPGNDPSANSDWIGNTGGVAIYAIRMYNRALTEEEILQNRFADIATFYHLDLTNYYGMKESERAAAIKAFIGSLSKPDLSYETTGSGKTRTSTLINNLYEAAFPKASASGGSGVKYTRFYVTDGLKTHLNFLEVTEADNTADWLSVVMPDGNGGYTYSNLSTANAILDSYELVTDRKGTAPNGTYSIANDIYGRYFKTVSGGYSYAPTEEDPAVLDESGNLITYPGNTFMFGDGYIWSPYRDSGYYKKADGTVEKIDAATMSAKNESGLPFGDTSARALSYQRQHSSHLYIPSQRYDPKLPNQTQNGTYQFVMAFNVGGDGNVSTANSTNGDQNLKTPHIDISFNGPSGYSRPSYKGAKVADNVWSAEWGPKTIYKGHVAKNEALTLTSVLEVLDNEIPEESVLKNGEDFYAARANYAFYIGFGSAWFNNDSFTNQPVIDGTRWLSNNAPSIWNRTEVGYGGGTKIYAVRVYDKVLTEAEMIQNQFADVVGFYHLDAGEMLNIPETRWGEVYPIFKDIKLDDASVSATTLQATLNDAIDAIKATIKTDLVIFEGYQARYADYNGLRSLYTVNEDLLAEIEAEGLSVEFGAIYAKGEETAIEGEIVDGEFTVDGAEVKTVYRNGMYIGEYFINEDTDEKQFTYTVKFEGEDATKANFEEKAIFLAYAVISDGETSEIEYFASDSKLFEDAVSLRDVAKKYYDDGNGYYRVIQDALGACGDLEGITGKAYEINGANLGDYTIVTAPETMKFALDLKAAIKVKNGYEILITDKAVSEGPSIKVGYAAVEDGVWAVEFNNSDVSLTGHGIEELKAAIDAFLESFPESATDGAYVIPTDKIAP